ncbi:ABC transporter permease [Lagierella sp.]|uniref:ABC transporter permease n=1 Tax=Lagierella sp. TaxID=2849657 RepID=UPI002636F298|nr:ABC transporter permease [Lagierella sp.]
MKRFLKFTKRRPIMIISVTIITILIIMAVFAPLVAPYEVDETSFSAPLAPPSKKYLLGTDELSRDIFSRIVYGLRMSLFIGFVPTTINIVIGSFVGMLAGSSNKYLDSILMRIVDIGLSYPFMILAMAIVYNMGSGLGSMMLALVIFGWTPSARIIRSQTKQIVNLPYIDAAKASGISKFGMIFTHILPNVKHTVLVLYTMGIPSAILAEAGISFLGFGAQAPLTSLGLMVSKGRSFLFDAPWISIAPGVFILLLSLSFNFLGDELSVYFGIDRKEIK